MGSPYPKFCLCAFLGPYKCPQSLRIFQRQPRAMVPRQAASAVFFRPQKRLRVAMASCENRGPFLGTLNNRCRIILGTPKGTINFDNHSMLAPLRVWGLGG